MIYYIGMEVEGVPVSKFQSFMNWSMDQPELQFDIETSVTDDWCTKKIISMQFGSIEGEVGTAGGKEQWFLQWSRLKPEEQAYCKWLLEGKKLKIIHNGAFECIVCLFHNIRVQNVYDTMLGEMILNCGLLNYGNDEDDEMENPEEATFYSLSALCYRYMGFYLMKSEYQLSFGDDIMTAGKIIYGVTDVKYLGAIKCMQIMELKDKDLDWVAALENEVLLVFSMMTYEGMELNVDDWRENISLAVPIIEQAKQDLARAVVEDDRMRACAVANNWYSENDRYNINWNSPAQKAKIFRYFFPQLPGGGKAVLKAWLKQDIGTEDEINVVGPIVKFDDYSQMENYIYQTDREWLIDNEFLVPGRELIINWGSAPQKLILLQSIMPRLTSTDKRSLEKLEHMIREYMLKYSKANKLITTYGEKFLNNIEPDGKIRTLYKQIVSTGRVSARPNIQQIPRGKGIGMRYRNAFKCDVDEVYTGSDYTSQELVYMATISGEPSWLQALENGWDLHSICAQLVLPKEWKAGTEPGCAFAERKVKCKCKKHLDIREDIIKPLNFGIPYGMSHFKLAADSGMTVPEAKAFLEHYFKIFPKLGRMLREFGNFGMRNGYIITMAPFFRKRWFPYWHFSRHKVEQMIAGIIYDSNLGSIERQSKNTPIQGSSADLTKVSLCAVYWHVFDNGLQDLVKFKCQVHDALYTTSKKHFADEWKKQQTRLMEEAALFCIPSGLLKAESKNTATWGE